ncbi:MAG: SMC-Scp complex subunit ScpB, partial [Nitrospinae bacterium]|nr:SMC-Scp complex subunit ScpB [Nitrospinota bacterium]
MGTDTTESGLEIQSVPEDVGVTEAMGLIPEQPPASDEAPLLEIGGVTDSLDEQELKGIIESLLYVSHEPLTVDKVTSVLAGPPKVVVNNAIRALQQDYDQEGRGLHIVELAGGFSMITRADCAPWITRLQKVKASAKVSRSAMETLAIIAYKQPIVRSEIEQIRGVETSGVLRTLLDQKLIRMVGRKDIPGRPIFPGVLMIESAAQLAAYVTYQALKLGPDTFVGFGGIDRCKFRKSVEPGQTVYLLCQATELRSRRVKADLLG